MNGNMTSGQSKGTLVAPLLVGVVLLVAGCSTAEMREALGVAGGGALGAVIAKELGGGDAAIAAGALVGALAGLHLARRLNDREKRALEQATQRAADPQQPTNSRVRWASPDPADAGTVTASGWVIPTSDIYVRADGRRCREVKTTLERDGQVLEETSEFCEVPGRGTWTTAGIDPNGPAARSYRDLHKSSQLSGGFAQVAHH